MRYAPERPHRRSIRLKGDDYAQLGAYFVTLCIHNHECLLGAGGNAQMQPNDAGRMVERWWQELNRKFPTVRTDAFVVMPNHFHGIIIIVAPPRSRGRPPCLPPWCGRIPRCAPTANGTMVENDDD